MTDQLPLPQVCPRCGRRVQFTLPEAAALAIRNKAETDRMKFVFPDRLKLGIQMLALVLPCLAGTCSREEVL